MTDPVEGEFVAEPTATFEFFELLLPRESWAKYRWRQVSFRIVVLLVHANMIAVTPLPKEFVSRDD